MKTRGGMAMVVVTAARLHCWWAYLARAAAYPTGPQLFVTDLTPTCATCHSMLKAEYTPERPADSSTGELPANKHYKALESADKGYKLIPEDKRKAHFGPGEVGG